MKDKVKLVIEMSEEVYKTIKECTTYTTWAECLLMSLVKNAAVLEECGNVESECTDAEIAKSFIEDVEAVKDQLPCGEQTDFEEKKKVRMDYDSLSLCTQKRCLKNHNVGITECYEKYCLNRTMY